MVGMRQESCEVLVAGGGMAGIAAAIASARAGAKTVLIENAGWLGGMGITGATGLHSFFNVFDACPGAVRARVVAGIGQALVDRVREAGGGIGHVRMERGGDFVSMLTPVEPEVFKMVAARTCREAGVTLLLHTVVDEVAAANGAISRVRVMNKSGPAIYKADQYIDCTGDGDLAAWAGAPFMGFKPGDPGAYSAGFTFRLCNVDLQALEADLEAKGVLAHMAHAVKPGMKKPDLVRLGIATWKMREKGVKEAPEYFFASSLRPRELTYCNCINYGPNDGLDAVALTEAEVTLREGMFKVAEFFRTNFKGCAECYPAGPAPSVGQRRSRAIRCDYELTQADCTEAREFNDQVARFGFIDNGKYFVKNAGAYGIPFRALVPKGVDNLLIAGRMMTVDTVAHNSTRNTVCCLACGEAAGMAAAMAGQKRTRDLDVEELRGKLAQAGALLKPVPDPV